MQFSNNGLNDIVGTRINKRGLTTASIVILGAAVLGVASIAPSARASVILLNFGPGGTPGSTTSHTSPGDTAVNPTDGAWTFSSGSALWNQVGLTSVPSGSIKDFTGSTVSGVSVLMGQGYNYAATGVGHTPGNVGFVSNPTIYTYKDATLGTSGVYAHSITNSAYFTGGPSDASAGAVEINGLAPGTYEIYLVGANTNGLPYASTVYAGDIGQSPTSYNYLSPTSTTLTSATSVTNPLAPASWVAGTDYAKFTITIANAGDSIGLFDEADRYTTGGTETRGFLNSVEIISVPEPASFGLITIAAGAMMIRRRRQIAGS